MQELKITFLSLQLKVMYRTVIAFIKTVPGIRFFFQIILEAFREAIKTVRPDFARLL